MPDYHTPLYFPAAGVQRIVDHAYSSTDWGQGWEGRPRPQVVFVHDHGIYLLSNGEPPDLVSEETSFIVYAEGYNPHTDDDALTKANEAVGRDHFGEFIDLSDDLLAAIRSDNFLCLEIEVSADTFSIGAVMSEMCGHGPVEDAITEAHTAGCP
jgi:hypothetical protein